MGSKGGQTALLPPLPLGFARAMKGEHPSLLSLRLALSPMIYFTPWMLASPASSGTFGALGFSASVICHEKDMSQGATDPARLKPHGEELVPSSKLERNPPVHNLQQSRPAYLQTIGSRMHFVTSLSLGMVCYTTLS